MVQGTSSSVGKSLLVAGLCRLFARRGVKVAPFKAQNMSNNAAVCPDGAEIGRAQALQALAAGIPPSADMNPVLLKPEADARSQVIVRGRVWQTLGARHYYERKQHLWGVVTESLDRIRSSFDLVVIEGAGSPVELNLKSGDIVNMAVARYACAPVLLAGDIDRGGVFAQLLGTLWLLPPEERALVRGLIVNKFRGDPTLFQPGIQILEERGGVPVLGVVPFLTQLDLPDEDAVAIEGREAVRGCLPDDSGAVEIAVVRLPRIANFDDFDPLRSEPGVRVRYVEDPSNLGRPHAIILPGTKSTIADLRWLRTSGLADEIARLAGRGAVVVGICGGYQMLGTVIRDPESVESAAPEVAGLGLLPVETTFVPHKATCQVRVRVTGGDGNWLASLTGEVYEAYEIHLGRTTTPRPWAEIVERNGEACSVPDGAMAADGRVWGCYLHGLLANDRFRRAWLASLQRVAGPPAGAWPVRLERALDRLADAISVAIPVERLERIISEGVSG
jgi:adenosylcobyric acid synthase